MTTSIFTNTAGKFEDAYGNNDGSTNHDDDNWSKMHRVPRITTKVLAATNYWTRTWWFHTKHWWFFHEWTTETLMMVSLILGQNFETTLGWHKDNTWLVQTTFGWYRDNIWLVQRQHLVGAETTFSWCRDEIFVSYQNLILKK